MRAERLFVGWLVVWLAACSQAATPLAISETAQQNAWVQIYFSDPDAPESADLHGGPDEPLVEALDAARLSVDVAAYDLNLYDVRDALLAAHERGVQVRMVVESDNFAGEEMQQLAAAGIPIVTGTASDFMHDKFVIIDRYQVWTGSMNYTLSDAYDNRNNLITLSSTRLAQNYETEFNEMFLQRRFGPSSPADTPFPQLEIDDHLVETYFSPEDETIDHLLALVNGAEKSVYFLAFSFTSDDLAIALIAAEVRGVEVRGVLDAGQAVGNQGGEYENLREAGIDVRLDGEGGSMHNKILIIDGEIVVTGSYNFSANAEDNNDENTLIIHDKDLAGEFTAEFWLIWNLTEE
jgi:phosphatidylserine/phosphatidylglycerophosphate/cardiolipin synthase-like enzyme